MKQNPRMGGEGFADCQNRNYLERQLSTADFDPPSSPAAPTLEITTTAARAAIEPLWPVVLNDRWRCVYDPAQWILEHRISTKDWRGSAFCWTRDALIRNIRERCGQVDPDALKQIENLTEFHPDRTEGRP